jgi:hypothetical protein
MVQVCAEGYARGGVRCTRCAGSAQASFGTAVVVALLALGALLLLRTRRQTVATQLPPGILEQIWTDANPLSSSEGPTEPMGPGWRAQLLLFAQAAAQPARILVSFAQIVGQLGQVLHVEYPPLVTRAIAVLRPLLADVWGLLFRLDCVGLHGAYARFVLYVFALPLVFLVAVGLRFLWQRRRTPAEAKEQLLSNVFVVVFLCYPTVCNHAFGIFNCRALSEALVVLQSDYATECGTPTHAFASLVAGLVVAVVAFGIPLGFATALLRRARAFAADGLSAEVAGIFAARMGISQSEASDVIREVAIGKDYGFLLRAYGPRHYWFEIFDMLRKLLLVGVLVVVDRGSVAQVACAACLSLGFIMLHFKLWPYKLSADNVFKAQVEVQIFLTILAALLLKEDLSTETVDKGFYDVALITLFIVNVPIALVYTVLSKLRHARRLLRQQCESDLAGRMGKPSEADAAKHALSRHRAGLASSGDVQILRGYFAGLRAYAGRYRLHSAAPKYVSQTSVVCVATDIASTPQCDVAIKVLRHQADWQRELTNRGLQGSSGEGEGLDPRYVVQALAFVEVSREDRMRRERELGAEPDPRAEGEWLIAMPVADRSLYDVISAECPAGRQLEEVLSDVVGIARCLHYLHASAGIIHLDVKLRNICRFQDGFKLVDLDAAMPEGQAIDRKGKWSGAFMAPELARLALLPDPCVKCPAAAAMDVWAFGVVLFELLSGQPLLASERTADGLVGVGAQLELLNWRRLDKDRLALVLAEYSGVSPQQRRHGQDLVSCCLQARPELRPTMQEVLDHPFLHPDLARAGAGARALEPEPEAAGSARGSLAHWHFFLSHMQTEATDLVRTLSLMMKDHGCRAWVDMEADDLTLPGMRAGVCASDALLLVLTRGVLFRPYCVAEIFEAIVAEKPIVLVSEVD